MSCPVVPYLAQPYLALSLLALLPFCYAVLFPVMPSISLIHLGHCPAPRSVLALTLTLLLALTTTVPHALPSPVYANQ